MKARLSAFVVVLPDALTKTAVSPIRCELVWRSPRTPAALNSRSSLSTSAVWSEAVWFQADSVNVRAAIRPTAAKAPFSKRISSSLGGARQIVGRQSQSVNACCLRSSSESAANSLPHTESELPRRRRPLPKEIRMALEAPATKKCECQHYNEE